MNNDLLPSKLVIGDSLSVNLGYFAMDYPTGDWSFNLEMVCGEHSFIYKCAGLDSLEIPWQKTAKMPPGMYRWRLYSESSDRRQRNTIYSGSIELEPFAGPNAKTLTHAEKALAAIEAVLENKASYSQMQMMVGGRSLMRYDAEKLLRIRDKYRREVHAIKAADKNPNASPIGTIMMCPRW